ncbi:MAG: multidrug ABC transporter ATP-binding protein, partial [Bdellovibrio sp.]
MPGSNAEQVNEGAYDKNIGITLWLAYRPYLIPLILTCFAGFMGRVFLLANANLVGLWVDSLCGQYSSHCLPRTGWTATWTSADFLIWLWIFVSLGFFLSLFFRVCFSRLSALAVSSIHDETILRTSRFPMSYFDRVPVGRIVTRFASDYGNVFRLFGGPLAEFLAILSDLVTMILLTSLASSYFLPPILLIIAFHFVVYRFNREFLKMNRR